ncbi:MAG: hypothetical protein D5R96_08545 [Methanocalculus sp. MSAO_Arc2]|uniref:hypothetical protein n=1 Tax=Methanocalculus sp. MSAO_Arc2 TaxID=2293855 RepID=UPI000FF53032|nr:MAG: hypothetical protein D5R96_08545 [Methanocalculus sp. MSAO_Arc2]
MVDLLFLECVFTTNKDEIIQRFIGVFEKQRSILLSIPDVITARKLNLRNIISIDFITQEIDEAEILYEKGYARCACTLAGVALERHLKTWCDIKQIYYMPRVGIVKLAEFLLKDGHLDVTEEKEMVYLAGIRNDCSHPNEVDTQKVRQLIEAVKRYLNRPIT